MTDMIQVKLPDEAYRLLKRLSRKYDLPMGHLVQAAMLEIGDWDGLVNKYWKICKYCGLANDKNAEKCNECNKTLDQNKQYNVLGDYFS